MSKELAEAFNNIEVMPAVHLEYRLYYDASGKPISMSSHNHPLGQYVTITKQHYDSANYNCRVVGGKLQFDTASQFRVQLAKSTTGVKVAAGYANLVVEDSYPHIEYYDRNN
jgi:hypothetical protein